MATKADFTEDEWKMMQRGITGAGALVSLSDQDLSDSFGEAGALAKHLAGQRAAGPTELIRELANARGTGFGLTDSPQEIRAGTVAALQQSVALLATRAPEELDPYRQLVLGLAEAVAAAKGGVKPGETAALGAISEALGLAADPG